jgi:hypothetical protein
MPKKTLVCLTCALFLFCLLIAPVSAAESSPEASYDIVVYGGTSAGVIAAVQAKKMGRSAVIVCPDRHLGGLSSGGLGWTDTGNKAVIGGLAREFYHRVWKQYQSPDAWKWQTREEYGNKGQGTPAIDGEQRTMWIFEPHIAERVFEEFVADHQIPLHRDQWLDRERGVAKSGGRIQSITMLSGRTFRGQVFLDATYEGDLMAAAGVAYHVGREATSTYEEKWNGVQTGVLHHRHHFGVLKQRIDPYVAPATHYASRHTNEDYPRMGERIRLRKDFDISGFSPPVQAILRGLKQYGMFVADNGIDWAISVAPDERIPVLHEELRRVKGAAFEVVITPEAAGG